MVRSKSQLGWVNLPHLAIIHRQWLKHQVVIIPGDQPQEGIDGYGGKDFEKMKTYDETGKRHEKGQQAVRDRSMTMEKSWVKDWTDKKHEE